MSDLAYTGLACISRNYNLSKINFDDNFKYLLLHSGNASGYYSRGNFLHDQKKSKDFHLFLVVKKSPVCFQDLVIRESIKLSRDLDCDISLSPGQINFENKPTLMVRFRANNIEHVNAVVKALENQNIELVKDKKTEKYETLAFYKKYIEFKEIQEDVYQDNEVSARYFIKIPGLVSYDEFQKIINNIKNTSKYHMFDAFLVQLYYKNKMIDFAGIYSKNCNIDKFGDLKTEIIKQYKSV